MAFSCLTFKIKPQFLDPGLPGSARLGDLSHLISPPTSLPFGPAPPAFCLFLNHADFSHFVPVLGLPGTPFSFTFNVTSLEGPSLTTLAKEAPLPPHVPFLSNLFCCASDTILPHPILHGAFTGEWLLC